LQKTIEYFLFISLDSLMPKPFFFLLLTIISLNFSYVPKLFAHAGVDHGDNCFIAIGGYQLRLGGFQSEEKIGGGKHYCHIFPATGKVIFTFEEDIVKQLPMQMNLQFLAADSYWDVLFDNDNAFSQRLIQASGSAIIQYDFPTMGLYAMEIELQSDNIHFNSLEPSKNNTQRFLFLVGFYMRRHLAQSSRLFLQLFS